MAGARAAIRSQGAIRRVGVVIFVTLSTGSFDPLLRACARLTDRYEFYGQIGSSGFTPPFPFVRLCPPTEIEARMKAADLVISHGGTGMLSTLYRMRRGAVVVPRQVRYGAPSDEQVELSVKWAELGMAVLCLDVDELSAAIEKARGFRFRFPELPRLGKALLEDVADCLPPIRTGA